MGLGDLLNPQSYVDSAKKLLGGIGGIGGNRGDNEFRGVDQQGNLARTAGFGEQFGMQGAAGFQTLGNEARGVRQGLERIASGEESISAEQLRQGLQQNLAGQQAMAAGARPANQAMAARTASMNASRMGAGLAGQQAMAGIAERQAAQQALANMILQQRQQDLGAFQAGQMGALQGYGNIENANTSRFGALTGVPTNQEQGLGFIQSFGQMAAMSDERLKTEIDDGDDDAQAFLKGLKAYSYKYKDSKHGEGRQLGVMAQDLEKTRLGKQAVFETAEGKALHAGKLAGALAAAAASLNRRVEKLEKGK